MNVLILGSGAREHAIAWKVKQSEKLDKLFVLPGNAGIISQKIATCLDGDILDFNFLNEIVKKNNIDFIIVGPEVPLVNGIVDYFEANNPDIKIFGPNKLAAKLEGSKCFSKELLEKYNIPTAKFKNFEDENITEIMEYVDSLEKETNYPIVIKADGLASGKGVVIVKNRKEAENTILEILKQKIFGQAGNKIVIEKFLKGFEVSLHLIVKKDEYKFLPYSQDHKQIFDNDKGPNTGGMGAYTPCPLISKKLHEKIENKIVKPFLNGLLKENIEYKGILYIGLMICDNEPYVLEFNVRFGDPETQVLLPLIENDLLEIMNNVLSNDETFQKTDLKIKNKYAIGIILASKGYPEIFEKDKKIEIKNFLNLELNKADKNNIIIFYAGVKFDENKNLLTNGGRVLTFVCIDETLKKTIEKAYKNINNISFEGVYFRTDIGQRECMKKFL